MSQTSVQEAGLMLYSNSSIFDYLYRCSGLEDQASVWRSTKIRSDENCRKLEEAEISGRALIAMLRTGSLNEIISEQAVQLLQSKVLFSGILSSL